MLLYQFKQNTILIYWKLKLIVSLYLPTEIKNLDHWCIIW